MTADRLDDSSAEDAAEAEALTYLAEWINIQGDEGEVEELFDQAASRIPEKIENREG